MGITLLLGNTNVVEVEKKEAKDGSVTEVRHARGELGNRITTVSFPDDFNIAEQLAAVNGLWSYHSDDPPEWVESDDETLSSLVAHNYTTDDHACRVGRPKGWEEG